MPWKESHRMNERMRFVLRLEAGEKMTDLCQEFEISRKTGYKFRDRYRNHGPEGLYDGSKRPVRSPKKTVPEVEQLIVNLRQERPSWGASKIKAKLEREHPGLGFPSRYTIHDILIRHGLCPAAKKKRRRDLGAERFRPPHLKPGLAPNELWCADFKGQFRLGNQRYCYPLTITDHYSRYLIGCEALEDTKGAGAKGVFEEMFREYGLPLAIRTDNGAPFASRGLYGLSTLSAWWLRLGIELERIEPGHPEQNGRHERMHLTLKKETTRPAGSNLLQQQERFDSFKQQFNHERPHEALEMKYPSEFYQKSERHFPKHLPEPDYPLHDRVCRVNFSGELVFTGRERISLCTALADQKVGLREEESDLWRVSFMNVDLGFYDHWQKKFSPLDPITQLAE